MRNIYLLACQSMLDMKESKNKFQTGDSVTESILVPLLVIGIPIHTW